MSARRAQERAPLAAAGKWGLTPGAGLISRGRDAQFRPCKLEAEPLRDVVDWLADYRQFWDESLDRLGMLLGRLQTPKTEKNH